MSSVAAARPLGLRTGGAALLDQVLFGAAAFLVNVLLARWLAPPAYGAFTVGFAVLLLLGSVHTAVLTEPMLVLGAGRYRGRLRGYLTLLVAGHAALAALFAAGLGLAALALRAAGSEAVAGALAGLALALPGVLLVWVARRSFYLERGPHVAAAGDALYLALAVAGLAALAAAGSVTPGRAFAVLGLAGLAAGAVLVALARPALRERPAASEVLRAHWDYGRFSLAAQGLSWASGQIVLVLVPLVLGLHEAAAIGAVVNLFRPLHPVQQSAVAVLLPSASALAADGRGGRELRRHVRRFLLPLAGSILAYGLLLAALSGPLLHALYGGRYDGHGLLVLLVGLVYTGATVVQTGTVVLKATGNVRRVPLVFAVSAAVTLALSVPAMLAAGAEGAMAVLALSYVVAAFVSVRLSRRIA